MFHPDAELTSWGVALTVWLGLMIGSLAELYLRSLEWEIDDLRAELDRISRGEGDG